MIAAENIDGVAVLKLDRGVTNPINLELVEALWRAVAGAGGDPDVRAVVLTSASDKFFSIGWDIPELIRLGREDFTRFFRAFCRMCLELYALPKPVVAAVSGHATAGGCILAVCSDERIIASGRKLMGLNEIKLGLPIPYPADCILRDLAGSRIARLITEGGDFHPPGELLKIGLVDRVVPLEELQSVAIERAATLGAYPLEGYAAIKRDRVERVEAQVAERMEEKERRFMDLWFSPAARALVEAAAEKF
jgi:enoyl-CoA hydratase/carnithine racemase